MPLTGREKATIFLSMMGAEAAGRILRYLPDEMAQLIAAGVNHLPTPSPEALNEVMREFKSFIALPESQTSVPKIEEKIKPPPPKKSYAFLMYERPQMAAYLLSLIPGKQKADALQGLSREKMLIEELLTNLTTNSLSAKLAENLKEHFGEKLT